MPAALQSASDGRLTLAGRLDFESVPALQGQLIPYLGQGDALTIDLEAVEHFNSAGLALLLQWLEDAHRQKVSLTFMNLPVAHGELASLYNLAGLFGKD
ncbi:MAG: STAS domain-containing protein [Chromatiales bacterium]|jgi:phospholipid transport system transporter-binding protein